MVKAATLIQFERLSSNSGSRATTNESLPLSTADIIIIWLKKWNKIALVVEIRKI